MKAIERHGDVSLSSLRSAQDMLAKCISDWLALGPSHVLFPLSHGPDPKGQWAILAGHACLT